MVVVTELHEVTPDVVSAFVRLIPQLSTSAPPVTAEDLAEMVGSDATHVLIATGDDGTIIGSLTLVVFRIPTGVRAWIEDVVVDETARGTGAGAALNLHALELAASLGARSVDLTSRPSRVAANQLYRKLGFVQRETNIYRHDPEA